MSNSILTKRAIQNAFLELLNEKPLGKITVKDVSERCEINRNTFYYHYQDMLMLLEDMCKNDFDHIVEIYPELNSLEECLDAITQVMKLKKNAVMHIYNSGNRSIYVDMLWKICEYVVTKYLSTVFPDALLSEYDKQLVIKYFKCSCFGLVIDWISTGMKDEYVEDMHRILHQSKGVADIIIANCTLIT